LVEQGSHAELLQQDGVYARLVRIQTQVSKDPSVDRLLGKSDGSSDEAVDSASTPAVVPEASHDSLAKQTSGAACSDAASPNTDTQHGSLVDQIPWLDPHEYRFVLDDFDQPRLQRRDESDSGQAVHVVCTFPASQPEHYLSVRYWDEHGDDVEIGLIRDLSEWPESSQRMVRDAIQRHYLLRPLNRIHRITLVAGYLEFDVDTNAGRSQFVMRWTQSQGVEFGENGKLLIDTEDNRYVVHDVDELPKKDRERFLHYVYW
jgi:hypothetical protein